MKTKLVEIRHSTKIAWSAVVDDAGTRILIAPVEIEEDDKRTGDRKDIAALSLPAIAKKMLETKGTIPTIYIQRDSTFIQFGWLTSWDEWSADKGESLTYGECEDWLAACCQEFLTGEPLTLWDVIETSTQFCASPCGGAFPAWVRRRRDQVSEKLAAIAAVMQAAEEDSEARALAGLDARDKLEVIFLETAQRLGRFAEA